ncbi:MAG: DUF87 domain-containing protein [Desulfurococcales archaeon]|nr:DUF87 domain-containing protein [Desulfurococcales archaeon]
MRGDAFECVYVGCPEGIRQDDVTPARVDRDVSDAALRVGYTSFGEPYYFTPEELSRNLLIAGVVGSGKTTLVKGLLLESLRLGLGFIVYDYEGEYAPLSSLAGADLLRADKMSLALWRPPPGMDESEYVHALSTTLTDYIKGMGWEVSAPMSFAIKFAVKSCVYKKAVGSSCFREGLRGLQGEVRQQTSMAVLYRLDLLLDGPLSSLTRDTDDLMNALRRRIVIDLSPLSRRSRLIARTVAEMAMARLRAQVMARSPSKSKADYLIVLEEADHYLRPGPFYDSPLLIDLAHYRKRGVGMVMVVHGFTGLDRRYLDYIGNYAIFRLPATDSPPLQSLVGRGVVLEEVKALERGEAIMIRDGLPIPTRVKVQVPEPHNIPPAAELILKSVRERPWLSVRERRAALGLDGKTFYTALKYLSESARVKTVSVYTGGPGRPPKLIKIPGMNPSPEHEYGVVKSYETYLRAGCDPTILRDRKAPDLLVECCGETIAVEVETGTNMSREKIRGRLDIYDRVVVVCVTRKCMKRAPRLLVGLKGVVVVNLYRLMGVALRTASRC